MTDSVFRGYRGIDEIIQRMQPLVDWTKKFKPEQQCLRLERKDYDLIKRWPKAAHCHGIDVVGNEIWWQGLELVYDSGMSRYAKLSSPVQADIESF